MSARSCPAMSSTMVPLFIMMVRLPKVRAEGMLWVIIRQVMLFSATICLVRARTFSAVAGSRAAVCSSSSRSFGVTMVAMSRVRACRCPPDSSPTGWFIRSSRPSPSWLNRSRKSFRSEREIMEKGEVPEEARI